MRLLLAIFCLAASPALMASDFSRLSFSGDNPGNLKIYSYVPPGLRAQPSLLVHLHGCNETAESSRSIGFEPFARKKNFILIYIETQAGNNNYRCFNWYKDDDISRSGGELESIAAMIDFAKEKFRAEKAYLSGFSAGGYMAAAVAAVYPEKVEAVAVIGGGPYRCTTRAAEIALCTSGKVTKKPRAWAELVKENSAARDWPPLLTIHGGKDDVVNVRNQVELMKQWTSLLTVTQPEIKSGSKVNVFLFRRDNQVVLKQITVRKLTHSIPVISRQKCGRATNYRVDSEICAAREIFSFFSRQ